MLDRFDPEILEPKNLNIGPGEEHSVQWMYVEEIARQCKQTLAALERASKVSFGEVDIRSDHNFKSTPHAYNPGISTNEHAQAFNRLVEFQSWAHRHILHHCQNPALPPETENEIIQAKDGTIKALNIELQIAQKAARDARDEKVYAEKSEKIWLERSGHLTKAIHAAGGTVRLEHDSGRAEVSGIQTEQEAVLRGKYEDLRIALVQKQSQINAHIEDRDYLKDELQAVKDALAEKNKTLWTRFKESAKKFWLGPEVEEE